MALVVPVRGFRGSRGSRGSRGYSWLLVATRGSVPSSWLFVVATDDVIPHTTTYTQNTSEASRRVEAPRGASRRVEARRGVEA